MFGLVRRWMCWFFVRFCVDIYVDIYEFVVNYVIFVGLCMEMYRVIVVYGLKFLYMYVGFGIIDNC